MELEMTSLDEVRLQDHLGWKEPLKLSSPTLNLALPCSRLNHVPNCHIHAFLSIQSKPPLV